MTNGWLLSDRDDDDDERTQPITRLDGIIDLAALTFSSWLIWIFVATPVRHFIND